jgi:hypothetical protein
VDGCAVDLPTFPEGVVAALYVGDGGVWAHTDEAFVEVGACP